MFGADADELERIASEFRSAADELDGEGSTLTGILNRVSWLGDIATRYLDSWTGVQIPKIGMSTEFLRNAARKLDAHAAQQRDTSGAATGAIGMTVQPGGGPPRMVTEGQADAGGTYSTEYRGDFFVDGSDQESAGRLLIENLLRTTGDGSLIAEDEFQIISVNDGESFILVLPGVTDLISPDLGLSDEHRSVRDVDQYALRSAASTKIDDNEYAQMVQRAMERANIPYGADVAIVGHSYGADTALDLAADRSFNGGPAGYNVTHVVAAAYDSGPQLSHVPGSTEVLVLQNHRDAAVIAEMTGHGPSQIIEGIRDGSVVDTARGIGNTASDAATEYVDRGVDSVQFGAGAIVNGGSSAINKVAGLFGADDPIGKVDWGDASDIFLIEDGVTRSTDHQTVVVFEGGGECAGHHQNNYIEHVVSTTDQSTLEFYDSLVGAGYSGNMERWSVDVSVPK
jgi:hypothetical protein